MCPSECNLFVSVIFYTIFNTLFTQKQLHVLRSESSANPCSNDSTGGEGGNSRRNANLRDWERAGEHPRLHSDACTPTRILEILLVVCCCVLPSSHCSLRIMTGFTEDVAIFYIFLGLYIE